MMKGFLIFAIFLVCSSHAVPHCPEPEPGGGAVHLPNPDNCATFYECEGSTPILLHCMPGTWFNPAAGVCDWPGNVAEGICIPPPPMTTVPDELD